MTTEGQRSGYRAALRHPVGGPLWTATAVSVVGDYVAQGALLLLAFERTGGRAVGAAALFAVSALPALLSGALAGSWLDQIPRRRALATLQLCGAAIIAFPVLVGGLVPVFVSAAALGGLRAATASVRSATLAEAVTDEHRGPLLALLGTTQTVSEVVGYVSGVTVTVVIGARPALLADAATFVVAAAIIWATTFPPPVPRERRPPVTAGFREILSHPVLRLLAPLVWVTASVGALPEALATEATEQATRWTALVLAAGPLGHSVALLVIGRLPQVRRPSVQLTHFVTLALAFGVAALAPSPPWLAVGNLFVGAGVAWLLGPQLTFMRLARPERMAQVTGTMLSLVIVAEGIGSPAFAAIADATSVATAYRAAGVLVLVSALVGWTVKERTPSALELDHSELEPA